MIIFFTVVEVPPHAIKFTNKELKVINAFTIPKICIDKWNLSVHPNAKNKAHHATFPGWLEYLCPHCNFVNKIRIETKIAIMH